jgi:hypothetical protein
MLCSSCKALTYPLVKKVVKFIIGQGVLLADIIERILVGALASVVLDTKSIRDITCRVIEDLDIAGLFFDNATLVNVMSKQIVFHCDCDARIRAQMLRVRQT